MTDQPAAGPAPAASRPWHRLDLNDTVRVRLRPQAIAAFRQRRQAVNARMLPGAVPLPLDPPLDADGLFRCELWRLMRDFGHLIQAGAEPPFEAQMEVRRS